MKDSDDGRKIRDKVLSVVSGDNDSLLVWRIVRVTLQYWRLPSLPPCMMDGFTVTNENRNGRRGGA